MIQDHQDFKNYDHICDSKELEKLDFKDLLNQALEINNNLKLDIYNIKEALKKSSDVVDNTIQYLVNNFHLECSLNK